MKRKRVSKSIAFFLSFLMLVGGTKVLPVFAGASNIIVDGKSFEKVLSGADWNNPNEDILVKDGVLVFPKDSSADTSLISKMNAKAYDDFEEVIRAEMTMKITQLPKDETFILAFGLGSLEAVSGQAGNIEIEFTNNGGLKAGIVAYNEDGDKEVVAQSKSCGSVGSVLKVQAVVTVSGSCKLMVNGKTVCAGNIPVSGEGRFGILQTGSCGAEISEMRIVTHEYDRPENPDIFEDFENETMNVNALTAKMILNGSGPRTGQYVEEVDGNRVFRFQNVGESYLGTLYQYSNFEMTFDVLNLQRKTEYDDDGNVKAYKSQNFCISFGDESADYNGGSYTQSTDLLIFQSTSFTSLTTPNNVNAATKGYPFGADTCDKDFTIKFSVVDSVVTASIKWIDETEFTEIIRYQVSEETPTGYVHIWTTGTSSTFDIDNLRIKNLDTKPNLVEVEYKSGLITAPPDFAYEPLEHVYEEESEEAAGFVWNDYYMIPCVAVVCILAFGIALVIKVIKQKGGKRHAQKNMEKSS